MTHLPPFLCCLAGFAALALAMDRPQEQLWGRTLAPRAVRRLRIAGTVLLLAALGWLVRGQGWGLGLVAYSGHTSLAAGVVFGALVMHDRMRGRRR